MSHHQIVGASSQAAFVLSGSNYITLEAPGSVATLALGINNAGDIVGSYSDGRTAHGFLYSDGIYMTIDVPGARSTEIQGINNNGQIVGFYDDASGHS